MIDKKEVIESWFRKGCKSLIQKDFALAHQEFEECFKLLGGLEGNPQAMPFLVLVNISIACFYLERNDEINYKNQFEEIFSKCLKF